MRVSQKLAEDSEDSMNVITTTNGWRNDGRYEQQYDQNNANQLANEIIDWNLTMNHNNASNLNHFNHDQYLHNISNKINLLLSLYI